MVAQNQEIIIPKVSHQPWLLVFVQGEALEVVISQASMGNIRKLGEREKPLFLRGNCHTIERVRMEHTHRILTSCVNAAVDDESRRVDLVLGVHDLVDVD